MRYLLWPLIYPLSLGKTLSVFTFKSARKSTSVAPKANIVKVSSICAAISDVTFWPQTIQNCRFLAVAFYR